MNRILDILRLVLVAFALGLASWWWVTGSGPYGWLNSRQAELFNGEFYPVISGLFALICTVLPAGVIGQFLRPGVGRGPVEAFLSDPAGAVSAGPIVLGNDSLVGWPKAGVVVSAAGIELARGGRTVFCPWCFFDAEGSPVDSEVDSVVVPIRRDHAGEVELLVGGKVAARGAHVSTPFFRWRGEDQVKLTVEVALPIAEFGRLLSLTARSLRGRR